METIIKIVKCFVYGVLFVIIFPYVWINFVIIGLKWTIRGIRSGWKICDIKTEIGHEREEFLSRLDKQFETL